MSFFNRSYNDDDLLGFPQNNLELEREKNKHIIWKNLSLICFGVSILSKIAFIFAIPLNLLGILFAIIYTFLKRKICWSGFLNVLCIIAFLFVAQMTLSNFITAYPQEILETPDIQLEIEDIEYEDNFITGIINKVTDMTLTEIEKQISQLQGNWILTDGQKDPNIIKCVFNNDYSFSCFEYEKENETYIKGTYKIKKLSIKGNSWNPIALSDFDWNYLIETTINDCSVNGIIQQKPLLERYNIEILANNGVYESEGFFTNSNNKYSYSGKKYK